jgi:RNA polymerase sigma-70 factor (ECF subfamily)
MSDIPALAQGFRARWKGSAAGDLPGLEETLGRLWATAREAWPEVDLDPESFVAYLAERVPADGQVLGALAELHASDLYLACGCALRDPRALEAFERLFLAKIPAYVAQLSLPPTAVDEVRQTLAEKLLVASGERAPKIGDYAGRGALDAWMRIAAIRSALSQVRREKNFLPLQDNSDGEVLTPRFDPEIEMIKVRHRVDFEKALREALASLEPRDRNVLRLHFLDGLGIGEIGVVYGVHRTTVSRWLALAQAKVLENTRQLLRERLRLDPRECESLLGVVASHLDVTLHSLLKSSK